MTPSDPLEAGVALAKAFDSRGIPYALGGALAYGLWAVPRATVDVDVNAFVEDAQLDSVLDALADLGVTFQPEQARRENAARGMFVARFGPFRVDVFTPSIDFAWEAMRTRVPKDVDGTQVYFLSAEALAVFKLLFFRGKDIVDLRRLVAVQGQRLDAAYVRRHLVALMGEDDERVAKWDELTRAQVGGA